jgi:DNA-directed RNA polymerase subunit delta
MDNKKRVIVDYKTLPENILEGIATKYPYGYGESDIIKFRNAKGDLISAIRFETDETIYMVKVSTQLKDMMKEYDLEDDFSSSSSSDEDSFGSGFDGVKVEEDEEEDDSSTVRRRSSSDDEEEDDDDDDY